MVGRRHKAGGWDVNGVLRKELLKVDWGYIVVGVTCTYVMVSEGGVFQVNFDNKIWGFQLQK